MRNLKVKFENMETSRVFLELYWVGHMDYQMCFLKLLKDIGEISKSTFLVFFRKYQSILFSLNLFSCS